MQSSSTPTATAATAARTEHRCCVCQQPGALERCPTCRFVVYCSAECRTRDAERHEWLCYAADSSSLQKLPASLAARKLDAQLSKPDVTINLGGIGAETTAAIIEVAQQIVEVPQALDGVLTLLEQRRPGVLWRVDMIRGATAAEHSGVRLTPAEQRHATDTNPFVAEARRQGLLPYLLVLATTDAERATSGGVVEGLAVHGAVIPRADHAKHMRLPTCTHVAGGLAMVSMHQGHMHVLGLMCDEQVKSIFGEPNNAADDCIAMHTIPSK